MQSIKCPNWLTLWILLFVFFFVRSNIFSACDPHLFRTARAPCSTSASRIKPTNDYFHYSEFNILTGNLYEKLTNVYNNVYKTAAAARQMMLTPRHVPICMIMINRTYICIFFLSYMRVLCPLMMNRKLIFLNADKSYRRARDGF